MAKVKIQSIIEHLDQDMKRALEDAFHHIAPTVQINRSAVYREFYRSVGRKFSSWVEVPDSDVVKKCSKCNH